jgi:translin
MDNLPAIVERIHQGLEARTRARDQALAQARALTRFSAHAIRAIHRDELDGARQNLEEGRKLVLSLQESLAPFPELFYAGYTQDAIKEFAEANLTVALITNQPLPSPEELDVEYATYLNGLAEAAGELRRRCLDIIRHAHSDEAERLLEAMDDIYSLLVTVDYPDAITGGLRRTTDLVRGVTERTRGDITSSLRQYQLQEALKTFEAKRQSERRSREDD